MTDEHFKIKVSISATGPESRSRAIEAFKEQIKRLEKESWPRQAFCAGGGGGGYGSLGYDISIDGSGEPPLTDDEIRKLREKL